MRIPSLSVSYCLAWSIASSSTTRAFSTVPATAAKVTSTSAATASTQASQYTPAAATVAAAGQHQHRRQQSIALSVASADTITVADMERGVGGRIEAAFEAAKEKGEAAFVTFITAGYPTAQGTVRWTDILLCLSFVLRKSENCTYHDYSQYMSLSARLNPSDEKTHRPFCWPCKREGLR